MKSKKTKAKRIVSGIRSTGALHLGHYFGALENWLDLQKNYDCFFFAADWHALTSEYKDTSKIKAYARDNVLDWLSVGIDPNKSTLFVQSHIKEHAELALLLGMITPLGWLERNPSYKEQVRELKGKEIANLGFLGYPVLQTADIILYKGDHVPVGQDQVPHIELSREITRRFNHLYGKIFPEPEVVLTQTPKVPGTDGRKMSNSYRNAIYLSDTTQEVTDKIMPMMTDPARKTRKDPGNPDICPLFDLHKIYTEMSAQKELDDGCRTAKIGCVDCKKALLERLLPWHKKITEKRAHFASKPKLVDEVLEAGDEKARKVAQKTMKEVRGALKL